MVDVIVRDLDQPDSVFRGGLIPDEFLAIQEQSRAFEAVIGTNTEGMVLRTPERAEPAERRLGHAQHVRVPRRRAAAGADLRRDGRRPGRRPSRVLSHEAWTALLRRRPSVVGRAIVLNAAPRTVIGVMPPRFTWHVADVWMPERSERGATRAARGPRWFQARLQARE